MACGRCLLPSSTPQVDSNKDRLVSLQEFLVATNKKEFLEPDSWEVSCNKRIKIQSKSFYFGELYCIYPACSPDPGAEPGLYRGGDEGV